MPFSYHRKTKTHNDSTFWFQLTPSAGCDQIEVVLAAGGKAESGRRREDPLVKDVATVRPQGCQEGSGRGRPAPSRERRRFCQESVEPIRPGGEHQVVSGRNTKWPQSPATLPLKVADGYHQVMPAHPAAHSRPRRPTPAVRDRRGRPRHPPLDHAAPSTRISGRRGLQVSACRHSPISCVAVLVCESAIRAEQLDQSPADPQDSTAPQIPWASILASADHMARGRGSPLRRGRLGFQRAPSYQDHLQGSAAPPSRCTCAR